MKKVRVLMENLYLSAYTQQFNLFCHTHIQSLKAITAGLKEPMATLGIWWSIRLDRPGFNPMFIQSYEKNFFEAKIASESWLFYFHQAYPRSTHQEKSEKNITRKKLVFAIEENSSYAWEFETTIHNLPFIKIDIFVCYRYKIKDKFWINLFENNHFSNI